MNFRERAIALCSNVGITCRNRTEEGATELLIYYPYREQVEGTKRAVLGMFDPSARLCTGSNLLSFAVPISKFMEMIDQMEESFLITDTWKMMQKRM